MSILRRLLVPILGGSLVAVAVIVCGWINDPAERHSLFFRRAPLEEVYRLAEAIHDRAGRYPETVEELVMMGKWLDVMNRIRLNDEQFPMDRIDLNDEQVPVDHFGAPILYGILESKPLVRSLGFDRTLGGTGYDRDLAYPHEPDPLTMRPLGQYVASERFLALRFAAATGAVIAIPWSIASLRRKARPHGRSRLQILLRLAGGLLVILCATTVGYGVLMIHSISRH